MKHSAAGTIPERAVQEYLSGDTQETISERYGVVPSAVSLFLKNRRVNIRGSKPRVQEQPSYLRGDRDVWTDTFPPHQEGAD